MGNNNSWIVKKKKKKKKKHQRVNVKLGENNIIRCERNEEEEVVKTTQHALNCIGEK